MLSYAIRRLLGAIPTLFIIVTLTFFVMRLAPGGPFDQEQSLPPQVRANLQAAYGLDQPLPVQYFRYLQGVVHGDFGPSFRYRDFTVRELIAQGLPVSVTLGLAALAFSILVGIPLGALAALHHNRPLDHALRFAALIGLALPTLVVAPLLALLFGIKLRWLPVGGWEPGSLRTLVLPAFALALPLIAFISRLTRASLLEVLGSGFIRTAQAKGMPAHVVVARHALRPALLPVVSYLGPATAAVLTGSLVVETVFNIPGMGKYLVQGALNRDYTLVMGFVVVYAALTLLTNLLADLAYGVLDPRVRHE
ncbi:MAG TPA: oligopeptide ABC transporter permease OppB [Steroidobacteraceae bacterium]|nr:oligopeptide ABC transporter permease OppB [Steroidobacteraceae bacterium]